MRVEKFTGYDTLDLNLEYKLSMYEKEEKSFETLFKYMFYETDRTMIEQSDGYRVKKTTYGEFSERIKSIAPTVAEALGDIPCGSLVGLYMNNSPQWIELFWAILMCGYNVLIMNTRLLDAALEKSIKDNSVMAVISDKKLFSVKTLIASEVAVASDKPHLDRAFGKEVVFMSSGTTENVKLCSYNGENFYYQLSDSVNVLRNWPGLWGSYKGEMKQLVILPFCHIFGFVAVYLWYSFFVSSFVFPKDLSPTTLLNTVKKHSITHIFAVPLLWEAVYKAAVSKIKAKSAVTWRNFCAMQTLTMKGGAAGDILARRAFRDVREGLFGDSIQLLISGGSHIKPEVLRFFNSIGYRTANGYGMTEVGITSVDNSKSKTGRSVGSIGVPFGHTEYSVSEDGELLVGGRARAFKITKAGISEYTDYDIPFRTGDLARCIKGKYFIDGRKDDLIVSESGENLNPLLVEECITSNGVDRACVFAGQGGEPILLASIPGCYSEKRITEIYNEIISSLAAAGFSSEVKNVYLTGEELIKSGEMKPNRRKIARAFASGEMRIINPKSIKENINELLSELESAVRECFAEALGKKAACEIGTNDEFFSDLGGTSIDYFMLRDLVRARFGLELITPEELKSVSVKTICEFIRGH